MNNELLTASVIGILMAQAVIDVMARRLPDRLNLIVFTAGIFMLICDPVVNAMDGAACVTAGDRLAGMMIIPMAMLMTNFVIAGAFGGGDIKLIAASGSFFGFEMTASGTMIGILTSGIYGSILLVTGKKDLKDHFALGPFLVAGFMITIMQKRNEVFSEMEPYQIVGIVLIAAGVILFAYYFHDKKKRKDDDDIDRLR